MSDESQIDSGGDPAASLAPGGQRVPLHFILCLAVVVVMIGALIALLITYGPAFTSHPAGVVQSDRPQASGARVP